MGGASLSLINQRDKTQGLSIAQEMGSQDPLVPTVSILGRQTKRGSPSVVAGSGGGGNLHFLGFCF